MSASWEHINYVPHILKLQILTLMWRGTPCPRALLSHCLLVQKGLLWYEILSSNQSASKSLYPEPDSLQINQLNIKFLFSGGSRCRIEANASQLEKEIFLEQCLFTKRPFAFISPWSTSCSSLFYFC